MEDNEIIGALDEKIQLESKCYQEYLDNGGLKDLTAEKDIEILCQIKEFINRLRAENDKYKKVNILIAGQRDGRDKHISELEAEIEKLETDKRALIQELSVCGMCKKIETEKIKSETRKEFAERLKEKCSYIEIFDKCVVFESDIDNLLEEMENEM